MKRWSLLPLLLSACAAPACRSVAHNEVGYVHKKPAIVHGRPHADHRVDELTKAYDGTVPDQRDFVKHASAQQIWILAQLDLSARRGIALVQAQNSSPNSNQMVAALSAISDLQHFLKVHSHKGKAS